ncbi:MAG: metal ABC transporter permease [Pontiellaceae bacterium]|nr:metal ABC transporter permease [Pontiellaceae bacterium]MBN2784310.1 metal ABC transporter permease [Pontiellaceae bacterium]
MHDSLNCLYCQFGDALSAGLLVAAVCSVLGVYVILKRAVFIGITLSEVATCGVAAAFLLGTPPFAGSLALVLGAVALLSLPFERQQIPRDALMGILFIAASALSVLLVAKSGPGLMEIDALLYGDLILTSRRELVTLLGILVPALLFFVGAFRPILYTFLDRDAARVLGIRAGLWETLYFLVLGIVIAATSQIAGALLIFCYLVVCPATALILSKRLMVVLWIAPLMAMTATFSGMLISFHADLPTNQTICIIACLLFITGAAIKQLVRFLVRLRIS